MSDSESTPEQRPAAAKLTAVYRRLVETYGIPDWHPSGDALGELIGTMLSQSTSDTNSHRAYAQLVAAFPRWESVRDAPVEQVAAAIHSGGLANLKASRMQQVVHLVTSTVQVCD
ncbi:MAG TPA: hypothetical protein VF916_04945 [Ktedonobacterales bacterium]